MREITELERRKALENAVAIVRRNLPTYTYKCQDANSVDGIYKPIDNVEWTTGFWPGELWLSYMETGDEIFAHAAGIFVESFRDRIRKHVMVDHHDMGFLYSPSCVAAWMITRNAHAREAAIMAADNLIARFHEKGQFLQAWGEARDNYRYIIDCLLNLPLLYWASDETGDPKYRDIALRHTKTCISNSFREDWSSYHTFFMDPETGAPVRGETCQGYKADSSWARGQAWGVYGLALAYRHTGEEKYLEMFEHVSRGHDPLLGPHLHERRRTARLLVIRHRRMRLPRGGLVLREARTVREGPSLQRTCQAADEGPLRHLHGLA